MTLSAPAQKCAQVEDFIVRLRLWSVRHVRRFKQLYEQPIGLGGLDAGRRHTRHTHIQVVIPPNVNVGAMFTRDARRATTEYSRRFSCEEGFRDAKWYLGFKQARIKDVRAWSRLTAGYII
jgi:hypothetical protein